MHVRVRGEAREARTPRMLLRLVLAERSAGRTSRQESWPFARHLVSRANGGAGPADMEARLHAAAGFAGLRVRDALQGRGSDRSRLDVT